LALIPGLAVLTQLVDKTTPLAAIRQMGSLNRFALVGGAALTTFAGGTYMILQQLLKTPPKNPPQPTSAQPAAAPSALVGRPAFAPAWPAAGNPASPFALPGQPTGGFNRGGFPPVNNGFQPMNTGLLPLLPNNAPRFGVKAPRELTRQA
jgi:hypothetical protein